MTLLITPPNRPKELGWWQDKITLGENFFRSLIKKEMINWDAERKHLIAWFEIFNRGLENTANRRAIDDEEKNFQITKIEEFERALRQWNYAAKMFICAGYIAANKSDFPDALETPEGKKNIVAKLRERLNKFTQIIQFDESEILLFCALFTDERLSENATEIPFATATKVKDGKGKIHTLKLRRVQCFEQIRRNPLVFPETNVYAQNIDQNFQLAIETAYLLNEQFQKEYQFKEKFDEFGRYGIIWDVEPFYNDDERKLLAEFEGTQKKDSTIKPNPRIKELLDRKHTETIQGGSIGLAAAVGIYHTLRGKYPDERVLYCATFKSNQDDGIIKIEKVEEMQIPQKIQEAIDTTLIDTFVLHEGNFSLTQDNFSSPERMEIQTLLKHEANFRLKIIDSDGNDKGVFPPTIENTESIGKSNTISTNLHPVAKIDSLLRENVIRFLSKQRAELNKLEWHFDGQQLEVEKLHIEQTVFTERSKEHPKYIKTGLAGLDDKKDFSSVFESIGQSELFELSSISEREQTRWSSVTGKANLRLAIIGSPGSGKSFTTRNLIIEKIDAALKWIDERKGKLEDIELPLWLTAIELASQDTLDPQDTILKIIDNRFGKFKFSSQFYRWLERKLGSVFKSSSSDYYFAKNKHLFLVVDSLDELAHSRLEAFKFLSGHLDKPSLRLIVTCRKLQWEERIGWLGFTPLEKVEIAPFNLLQQRNFSRNFFKNHPDLQVKMQHLLKGNYALHHALTTPLLLTFGCLLGGEDVISRSSSYVQIYALVIRKMFIGDWRNSKLKPHWTKSKVKTEIHLNLLDKICWEIFSHKPTLNLFTLDVWQKSYEKSVSSEDEKKISSVEFLGELGRLGLIAEAGFNQKGRQQWSFCHRTFLEFLAARALSDKDKKDWLEIARQHLWFAPEWLECLTFLAGLIQVDEVLDLIALVKEQEDDIFGSMIFLEAKFVGASQLIEEKDIKSIYDKILLGLNTKFFRSSIFLSIEIEQTNFSETIYDEFLMPSLRALQINSAAEQYFSKYNLIKTLLQLLVSDDEFLSRNAGILLAEIIDTSDDIVVKDLITVLDTSKHKFVRSNTAHILGIIANTSDDILNSLQNAFYSGNDELVRRNAAFALGKLGDTSTLLNALGSDEYDYVHQEAIVALGEINDVSDAVITALLFALKSSDKVTCRNAVYALGRLGKNSDDIINSLLIALKENDDAVSRNAAFALSRLGNASDTFAKHLLALIQSENSLRRNSAVEVLGELGKNSDDIINALLTALHSSDDEALRLNAAYALGKLGNVTNDITDTLLSALKSDNYKFLHGNIARVIGKLYVQNKSLLEDSVVSEIEEVLMQRIQSDKYLFILDSDYATPLFRISKSCRKKFRLNLNELEDKCN